MTRLLVDTSVLIKWFHSEGEHGVPQARALRTAHLNGDLDAHVLDLAYYELGNVLMRALGWTPDDVADQLDDLDHHPRAAAGDHRSMVSPSGRAGPGPCAVVLRRGVGRGGARTRGPAGQRRPQIAGGGLGANTD